jgi:signal transduction histidine kinase/ActR/RegA family two-component response regulator
VALQTPAGASIASTISSEARRLISEGTLSDVLGSFGAVAVVSAAEYRHAGHAGLVAWAALMTAVLLVQLLLPRLLARVGDAAFLDACTGLGVALGLGWASCVLLVRPDDFSYEAFVVLALCVVCTAGSVFNSHHPPVLLAFQVASLGVLAAIYAVRGGTIDWSIAAGFAILMWTLIGYGRAFHRGFVRVIELGDENTRLVSALTAKTQALEQASQVKTRFLASASHDLRQPLHAMSLLVGVLAQRARGHGLDDVIERIDKSAEAMEQLLKAILDISRLDAGVERASVETLDVAELLARIGRHFAPLAQARGLAFRVRGAPAWVRSDEGMLARMLDNLVGNALRYTRRGGVMVAVRVRRERVVFEVRDSGIGIAPDRLDDIFEEFVQLHNPQRDRAKGLGLGLSIVRRTADLLGHRVDVASAPGRGSVFRLTVPRTDMPTAAPLPTLASPAIDVRGLAVLVIDDEPPIRQALSELLEAWGCHCIAAADGDDALAQLARSSRRPDAILCDYRLARGNGVDAVASLRGTLGARVPALIVTGDIAADRLVAIARSELPVMHKPLNPARLREWLAALTTDSGAGPAAPPPPPPASASSPPACETALPGGS